MAARQGTLRLKIIPIIVKQHDNSELSLWRLVRGKAAYTKADIPDAQNSPKGPVIKSDKPLGAWQPRFVACSMVVCRCPIAGNRFNTSLLLCALDQLCYFKFSDIDQTQIRDAQLGYDDKRQ